MIVFVMHCVHQALLFKAIKTELQSVLTIKDNNKFVWLICKKMTLKCSSREQRPNILPYSFSWFVYLCWCTMCVAVCVPAAGASQSLACRIEEQLLVSSLAMIFEGDSSRCLAYSFGPLEYVKLSLGLETFDTLYCDFSVHTLTKVKKKQ